MTDDDVTHGLNQVTALGRPYRSVVQPNHLETVIARLPTGEDGRPELWKYTRYFDNPRFWSAPGKQDQQTGQGPGTNVAPGVAVEACVTVTKRRPVERLAPQSGPVPGMPSCDIGPIQCRSDQTTPSDCPPSA